MGEFVKTNNNEHIAFIALDRGKSNALHLEMVQELQQEIERAKDNPAIEAIIIHGKEGFSPRVLISLRCTVTMRQQ